MTPDNGNSKKTLKFYHPADQALNSLKGKQARREGSSSKLDFALAARCRGLVYSATWTNLKRENSATTLKMRYISGALYAKSHWVA